MCKIFKVNDPIIHVGEIERELINFELERHEMSIKGLSNSCGVKYSTLKSFMNGTTEELRRDNIVLIANTFHLTYRRFSSNEAFDRIDVTKYFEEVEKGNVEKNGYPDYDDPGCTDYYDWLWQGVYGGRRG